MLKKKFGFSVIALGLLVCLSACSQPEDMVKVNVPKDVQKTTGSPEVVTLSQFRDVKEEYDSIIKAAAEKKAAEAAAVVKSLTSVARKTQAKYADQVASLQRQAEAEMASLTDDSEAQQAAIAASLTALQADYDRTNTQLKRLDANAQAKADSIRSLVNFGLNEVAPSIAGMVPGLGLALPLITGVAGLMIRKPGDAANHEKKLAAASDAAYASGMADAKNAISDAMTLAAFSKMTPPPTLSLHTPAPLAVPAVAPAAAAAA